MALLARTSLEQKSNGQHDPQSRPPSAQAEGWKACQQIQAARTTAAPRLSLQPDQQTTFRVGCLPQLVVSIAAVRSLTTAIRTGRLPLHDISAGDVHIHHYLPGIALLTAAGGIGVRGSDKTSVHCLLGATYGTGCALITDELPPAAEPPRHLLDTRRPLGPRRCFWHHRQRRRVLQRHPALARPERRDHRKAGAARTSTQPG